MTSNIELDALWQQLLTTLKNEIPGPLFEGYLRHIRPLKHDGRKIHLAVPSSFVKDGVERNLKQFLIEHLKKATGEEAVQLFIQIEPVDPERVTSVEDLEPETNVTANLNPKYRMEYYVVGAGNRFAHAASLAVVRGPGVVYNPLFLWGAVGVGKTHLMQAIGHQVLRENPRRKVLYVTAETFTTESIEAVREQTTKAFQRKYRTIDLLLIDDVQFFERTEGTQESFFHTFNELYQKGKQIVLTADRAPQGLDRLQDRLVNRFESGLTADIKPPDLETREAILQELADRQGISVDRECLHHLAERFTANVRELEGSFNRVAAFASLKGMEISIPLIESVLEELRKKERKKAPTAESITTCVAEYYQLNQDDLLSRRQDRQVILPRQIAMYLIYDLAGLTLKQIGQVFGKKDHSTVIHACDKVRKRMEADPTTAHDVKMLKLKFKETARES